MRPVAAGSTVRETSAWARIPTTAVVDHRKTADLLFAMCWSASSSESSGPTTIGFSEQMLDTVTL